MQPKGILHEDAQLLRCAFAELLAFMIENLLLPLNC